MAKFNMREAERRLFEAPGIAELLHDMERASRERIARLAEADPAKHKKARVFPRGVPASYRYFLAGKDGKGREVRFCYSVHRNVAGYFLGWREVVGKTQTKRDGWLANRTKRRLIERGRARSQAFKAKRSTPT